MKTGGLIYDLGLEELSQLLESWGEPPYRARQVWQGLYIHLWNQSEQFTNLPLSLRQKLAAHFDFHHLEPVQYLDSSDGSTRKTLFRLEPGRAIEAVLMRYHPVLDNPGQIADEEPQGARRSRRTLCISTQAGCAMGCVFCATGQMGFRRHLSSGEIVEQVLYYARQLQNTGEQVSNVVLMGMGEPFHNYDATLAAIDRLNHREGFNFGARRFTISTVGLVPAIERFTRERRQVNLAVSLHAVDNALRSSMMPVNRRYPVEQLLAACEAYVNSTRRRITFEWALIDGVNDSVEDARLLAQQLLRFKQGGSSLCHVNVIPLNPTQRYPGKATPKQKALAFKAELERHGIACTVRLRRGVDIQAGCGQLAIEGGQ